MSDSETLSVYAAKAQDYANLTESVNSKDPCLRAFIQAIPKGGDVLDLGCGPGASAAAMAQSGLKVTAYDPVPEMIVLAGKHAGVNAQLAGFTDVNGIDIFDGIWANFSLLHAVRRDMPDHLARIATALRPGGRFHIAVKTGAGSQRDNIGRYYSYYEEDELNTLLTNAGLTVIERREGLGKGLAGDVSPWIALAAHA
ncbi:MAG: class I SAM-dependent methyltransferase [Roseobacter sp.]